MLSPLTSLTLNAVGMLEQIEGLHAALATTEDALSKAKARRKALKSERKEEEELLREEKSALETEHAQLLVQVVCSARVSVPLDAR